MKKIYFMDRIKSGILESNDDTPMNAWAKQSVFSTKPLTGKERRAEKRADKWASIEAGLEKEGSNTQGIKAAKAVFDRAHSFGRGSSGRPLGTIPNKNKGIYPTPGRPKGSKDAPVTIVGRLKKKSFVSTDSIPDNRHRPDNGPDSDE
jgi:hypothetical protein